MPGRGSICPRATATDTARREGWRRARVRSHSNVLGFAASRSVSRAGWCRCSRGGRRSGRCASGAVSARAGCPSMRPGRVPARPPARAKGVRKSRQLMACTGAGGLTDAAWAFPPPGSTGRPRRPPELVRRCSGSSPSGNLRPKTSMRRIQAGLRPHPFTSCVPRHCGRPLVPAPLQEDIRCTVVPSLRSPMLF